ncbi:hypothetical protein [Dokdonia sp.]|uniref:hypothetical protein n=1 Tax=Dokdonia sp. TaxID=2024995 RepID=UPI003266DF79
MKLKLVLLSGFLFLYYSCSTSNTKAEFDTITLAIETELSRLSDDSFISDIRSIDFKHNQFYLTDYSRNEILILDEDLTLKNTAGTGGEGPGEFNGASSIKVSDDFVYVINDGKQTVEVFKENEHVETINPQIILSSGTPLRFGTLDNTFYFSNPESLNSVSHYKSDDEILSFGEIYDFPNLSQTLIKNYNHVLMHSNGIITVSDNLPTIVFYDLNKNVLSKMDYGNLPLVQEHLDVLKRNPTEDNSYYILATDAYLFLDTLYVLLTLQNEQGPSSNKVLEIKINKDGTLRILNMLGLGDGWYTTLCVNDSSLLSFDRTRGNVVKFQL